MKISVVIPTINRKSLDRTLDSLKKQTRQADEIIPVEDISRNGPAWARNQGITKSSGDYIAFIDDDCVARPDWLEKYEQALTRYNADGAGSGYIETDELLKAIRESKKYPTGPLVDSVGLVGVGGNVIYKKENLLELQSKDGYIWNEKMRIAEDWELAWRLRRNNAKLVVIPNHVTHLKSLPMKKFANHMFSRGKGIATIQQMQKQAGTTMQRSLIWNEKGDIGLKNVLVSIAQRAIGPFNKSDFPSTKTFIQYWFGEKIKTLGFIWGLIKKK